LSALVAGVIGTTAGLFEARRQADIARGKEHEADEEKQKALSAAREERQAKQREAERVEERNAALDDANHQLDNSNFLLAVAAYDNRDVSLARLRLDRIQANIVAGNGTICGGSRRAESLPSTG